MTPAQAVNLLAVDLGLSTKDLEAVLGTEARTIGRWVAEHSYPQREARRRLAALIALHRHLSDMFTTMEAARDWLRDPSRYLAGLTPLEVLRVGRVDRAEDALLALESGIYL
jgi:uncharacterized protein (DUF2384 family)